MRPASPGWLVARALRTAVPTVGQRHPDRRISTTFRLLPHSSCRHLTHLSEWGTSQDEGLIRESIAGAFIGRGNGSGKANFSKQL